MDRTLFPRTGRGRDPRAAALATGSVPVTPVVSGRPVALVSTAADGVPSAGVTSVGLVLSTLLPEPVEVVTPCPR